MIRYNSRIINGNVPYDCACSLGCVYLNHRIIVKKVLTILFLSVYAVLSLGLNILVHTCGGESEALLVTTEASDPCACGDEAPMEDMCCTTELKTVQLDDSQKVVLTTIEDKLFSVVDVAIVDIFPNEVPHLFFVIPSDTSPPPNKDLNISNSVFLI